MGQKVVLEMVSEIINMNLATFTQNTNRFGMSVVNKPNWFLFINWELIGKKAIHHINALLKLMGVNF